MSETFQLYGSADKKCPVCGATGNFPDVRIYRDGKPTRVLSCLDCYERSLEWALKQCVPPVVKFTLADHAFAPEYAKTGDAGADLRAISIKGTPSGEFYPLDDRTGGLVPARGKSIFGTGVFIELPEGYRARYHSRSGLSAKNDIEVGAGLIDNGYRGELIVILYNHGDKDFLVGYGDKIAQVCIEKFEQATFEHVLFLSESERGAAGLGSTGV